MLNIKFTFSGGGGLVRDIWYMRESRRIQSQELLLLALLLVSYIKLSAKIDKLSLRQYILLGWELRVIYYCTMCARHPDLVSLDFYAIPIFPF